MSKKKALGRGLSALLSDNSPEDKLDVENENGVSKVYIPKSKLSTEDIVELKNNQGPVKKRKQFSKIQVNVPKISELKNDAKSDSKQEGFTPILPQAFETKKKDINSLFNSLKYVSMEKRLKAIHDFNPKKTFDMMQLKLMQQGGDLVKIVKIIDFPTQKFVGLPGSEVVVEEKPSNDWNGRNIYCTEKYGYKMKDNQCYQSENCIEPCHLFMRKLQKIREWLTSLESQIVSIPILCETLNEFGIIRRPDLTSTILTFHVYCEEYKSNGGVSVPQIPFFYLKL